MSESFTFGPRPMSLREIVVRALKTGVQAALSTLTVAQILELVKPEAIDVNGLEQLALAAAIAFGAGVWSVIHNALLTWSRS